MAGISSKAAGSVVNKKKFNGYELNTDFGINLNESFYRSHDPQLGRFWQIDPKLELYDSYSPYAFVANNAINICDPLGDKWKRKEDQERANSIIKQLENRERKLTKDFETLQKRREGALAAGKKSLASTLAKQSNEVLRKSSLIHNATVEIAHMAIDDVTYKFVPVDESSESTVTDIDGNTGEIAIPILSDLGAQTHELTHGNDLGSGIVTMEKNNGKYSIAIPDFIREQFEVKGYRVEYAINGSITQKSFAYKNGYRINSLNDINGYYVAGIYDTNPTNKKADILYPQLWLRYTKENRSGLMYKTNVK